MPFYLVPYTVWPSLAPPHSAFYILILCAYCCSWPRTFGLIRAFAGSRLPLAVHSLVGYTAMSLTAHYHCSDDVPARVVIVLSEEWDL